MVRELTNSYAKQMESKSYHQFTINDKVFKAYIIYQLKNLFAGNIRYKP